MYNYTIIIPHHNTQELLLDLLNSIPQREDVQIIIVDDNSDPSVVDFTKFPWCDRKNTEVILTKEGKGAGYARNVGLQKAQGKWVLFSDSDDFFDTNNLSKAFDKYVDSDADIVFFNANRVEEKTGKVLSQHLSKQKFYKNPKKYKDFLKYWSNVPWAKFIKKSIIVQNDITFSEVPSANDLFFSTVSGFNAQEVVVDFSVIYNYRVRLSGSITSHVSKNSIMSRLLEASKRNEYLWSRGVKKWCTNPYTSFCDQLLAVGCSYSEAKNIIEQYYTVGPMKRWYFSYLLREPMVYLKNSVRRLLHK